MNDFYLAITTFNRLKYLKNCLETFEATKNNYYNWKIIVADNFSNDGTIDYLSKKKIILIKNKKKGVNHQTNSIINFLKKIDFNLCFKIDDDIFFKKKGWDDMYFNSIKISGYEHLIFNHFKRPNFKEKIFYKKILESKTDYVHALGCFFTLTPNIIKKVGFFDVENFGFQESGHIDYSQRCGILGFNHPEYAFDIINSNEYIGLESNYDNQLYFSSLPEEERYKRRTNFDPFKNINNFNDLIKKRLYVKQNKNFLFL